MKSGDQKKSPKGPHGSGIEIQYLPVAQLVQAEYNPRYVTAQDREDIRASLAEYGAVDPAVVNSFPGRENVIVGGNQRVKIAKELLGWDTFPCVLVRLNHEQEKKLNIRLNKNVGRWDWDILKDFGREFLLPLGFSDEDLSRLDEIDLQLNDGVEGKSETMRGVSGSVVMWINRWSMVVQDKELEAMCHDFVHYSASISETLPAEEYEKKKAQIENLMAKAVGEVLAEVLPEGFSRSDFPTR